MNDDPSALWGSVVTTVGATVALLVAFGVELTDQQVQAVLGVFAAVGPLVTALLIRRTAWRPSSVRRAVAEAAARGEFPPDLGL